MAQMSIWLRMLVVLVIATAFVYALPNVLPKNMRDHLPEFMPHQTMTLGLDLQGGAHLVLEVQMSDVAKRAYENLEDQIRSLGRDQGLGYMSLRSNESGVTFNLRNANQGMEILKKSLTGQQVMVNRGDGDAITLTFSDSAMVDMQKRAIGQVLQVLRSRVDQFGVAEPLIQQQGANRVIVELPGVKDVSRAKAAIGKTAQLTFHMVDESADPNSPVVPYGKLKLQDTIGTGANARTYPLIVEKRPSLTGEMLTSAAPGFDQNGVPAVDIAFDARGTKLFAKLSTENVGKRFAIVLDGKVYSAPAFREAILGGRAQISGSFTVQEAQDLAAILNAGALPAAVHVVEERTVGPSLGADSVKSGQMAMVIGLGSVLVFMVIFYGLFGAAANVALVINLVLLLAAMSALGFTMTLPGMAGIVLTLGMAVDANVLIFERMREEVDYGKKPFSAMLAGFDGAFRTILDGHVTTLVAAVILFLIGTGPVKGFAVSLTIGLLASLFTSVSLTRWILISWARWAKPKHLPL
jgi:preprotein translocase subunit SecD